MEVEKRTVPLVSGSAQQSFDTTAEGSKCFELGVWVRHPIGPVLVLVLQQL
jgi:hypothetical protein